MLVEEEDDVAQAFLVGDLTAVGCIVWTADPKEKALAILPVRQPGVTVVDVNGKTLGLIDAIRVRDGFAGRVDPATPLIVLTVNRAMREAVRPRQRCSAEPAAGSRESAWRARAAAYAVLG